jgi:hypothetical protein
MVVFICVGAPETTPLLYGKVGGSVGSEVTLCRNASDRFEGAYFDESFLSRSKADLSIKAPSGIVRGVLLPGFQS